MVCGRRGDLYGKSRIAEGQQMLISARPRFPNVLLQGGLMSGEAPIRYFMSVSSSELRRI